MIRKSSVSVLFIFLGTLFSSAQDGDSTTLDYTSFIGHVKAHHPQVYRAGLITDQGSAYVLKAQGAFDPKLGGGLNQKYYDGKQYYSYLNGALKIPTWFGITGEVGYDQNEGTQLNPTDRIPESGLWYAGLKVELGNGLLIDERRAELKKAKLYEQLSAQERRMMENELIYKASVAYWEWAAAHAQLAVYTEAMANAELRLEAVKRSSFMGDRPFIDTVEAGIQLQDRQLGFQEALLDVMNSRRQLELFLWAEGLIPLELDSLVKPHNPTEIEEEKFDPSLRLVLDTVVENHPYFQLNQLKIEQSSIDLRLSKEALKPDLSLKYNAIGAPVGNDLMGDYNLSNYTWGATLSYSLFTRKERADVKLSEIRLQDQKIDLSFLRQELDYQLTTSMNGWQVSQEQLQVSRKITNDYKTLFEAERKLFDIGESSLFMINAREKSYIDSQLKLIDQLLKNKKAAYRTRYDFMLLW